MELTEREYNEELERIHSRLMPLINICHENNTAVRIGVNHGSLSDRIMTRYGNTPEGMAISAMEFIRIFRAENFQQACSVNEVIRYCCDGRGNKGACKDDD